MRRRSAETGSANKKMAGLSKSSFSSHGTSASQASHSVAKPRDANQASAARTASARSLSQFDPNFIPFILSITPSSPFDFSENIRVSVLLLQYWRIWVMSSVVPA